MGRRGAEEDEDGELPWLAPASPERVTHVPRNRLRMWLAGLAALLVLVVSLIYALVAKPDDDGLVYAENGEVPLIRAPARPFKERPEIAGGMDVEGIDQTSYKAAGGVDPGGELALDALPEEPMARPVATPKAIERRMVDEEAEAGAKARTADPPAPKAEKPAPQAESADAGGGTSLQLGAFSSAAKANEAWKTFSGRYAYLEGLEKSVDKFEREGEKPLYRLRATGAASHATAENLCARLRVAGESCVVR